MMMDRYRFVEDDLQIGLPYTKWHADQARENAKLWHRMDSEGDLRAEQERYERVLRDRERLLFPGFADILIAADQDRCPRYAFRDSYGADAPGDFGGVKLCAECQASWTEYALSIRQRAALKIPFLKSKPRLAG
ncbi:hypothetical protein SAMN05443572_108255 [Myxococcus fulvus]|nr:hypothetical protein [Myxococcus fulvus]SEU29842.1 hypothetical protein SAMN05443572_108255 [Myxococcus fulvus]